MKYGERSRVRWEEAVLIVLSIVGLAAAWFHALTSEFTGDAVVDPVGYLAASPLFAAWLTFTAAWLAWMFYLDRKRGRPVREPDTPKSLTEDVDGDNVVIADGEKILDPENDDVSGHTDEDRLPARPDDFDDVPPAARLSAAADGMSEFNRILKEIAKSVWYITAILLGFFFVFMAFQVARWGLTLV